MLAKVKVHCALVRDPESGLVEISLLDGDNLVRVLEMLKLMRKKSPYFKGIIDRELGVEDA
jgi:hypothetical protein